MKIQAVHPAVPSRGRFKSLGMTASARGKSQRASAPRIDEIVLKHSWRYGGPAALRLACRFEAKDRSEFQKFGSA